MPSFFYGNHVNVDIDDVSPDWYRYFRREMSAGRIGDVGSGTHITVRASEAVLHEPREVYGITGGVHEDGRFAVPDGAGHWCTFNPADLSVDKPFRLHIDVCCSSFKPSVLLEWILIPIAQFDLARRGIAPVHASCASLADQASEPVVFSAWSGVGKTNLLLWALAHGGIYYGDDLVLVADSGHVLPSARSVAVYGYNREVATGLDSANMRKLRVGDAVHRISRRTPSRFASALSYASNAFTTVRAHPTELGGANGSQHPVAAHVICHSTTDERLRHEWREMTPDLAARLARSHCAVMAYEYVWFQRFLNTWSWATQASQNPWALMESRWVEILNVYFRRFDGVHELRIPRGSAGRHVEEAWRAVSSRGN